MLRGEAGTLYAITRIMMKVTLGCGGTREGPLIHTGLTLIGKTGDRRVFQIEGTAHDEKENMTASRSCQKVSVAALYGETVTR